MADLEMDFSEWLKHKVQCLAEGKCVSCGLEAAPRISTPEGAAEYRISGCCEVCFDEMFKEEE